MISSTTNRTIDTYIHESCSTPTMYFHFSECQAEAKVLFIFYKRKMFPASLCFNRNRFERFSFQTICNIDIEFFNITKYILPFTFNKRFDVLVKFRQVPNLSRTKSNTIKIKLFLIECAMLSFGYYYEQKDRVRLQP